jgi:hypothetical protein
VILLQKPGLAKVAALVFLLSVTGFAPPPPGRNKWYLHALRLLVPLITSLSLTSKNLPETGHLLLEPRLALRLSSLALPSPAHRAGGCVFHHDRPGAGAVPASETLPMFAFARPYSEQSSQPAWHAGFLAILPQVREHMRFAFRRMPAAERAEAMAEAVANVAINYARLHEQGKLDVAFPTTLADYAIRQYFAGRRVGSKLNIDDVSSVYCQRQRGVQMRSLDQRNPAGEWKELVVEDRHATPAEVAASRIDLHDWFAQLPRLKRGIAQTLATGETGAETASMFGVTPGRVSQVRRELEIDWAEFHGESLACA